jgi:transcriptional regulator with XRE-family HTH domain
MVSTNYQLKPMIYLPQNLKYLRAKKGLTQEQFAELIYKSRKTYEKWEQGITAPDLSSIQMLSTVHSITMEQLLNHDLRESEKLRNNIETYQHNQGI